MNISYKTNNKIILEKLMYTAILQEKQCNFNKHYKV